MYQRISLKLAKHPLTYVSGSVGFGWRLLAMVDIHDGTTEVSDIKDWLVDTGSMDIVLPKGIWERLAIKAKDNRIINLGGSQVSCIVAELQLRLVGFVSEGDFGAADTCEPPQTGWKSIQVLCNPGPVKRPVLGMGFIQQFGAQLVCDVSKQAAYLDVPTDAAS